MYPIYSAWVLDATTLLPNAALKGQQVQVVTRNTTTPYPIFNAASDPIPSSLVTVTDAASTPTVYIDTEAPETVYLDWYDAGSGQRGPIWFEEVSRESAMASAASSDASATSAAASAASAATMATEAAALRQWVNKGVTRRNLATDPRLTATTMTLNGATATDTRPATDGPDSGSYMRRTIITPNTASPMSMPLTGNGVLSIPVTPGQEILTSWYARKSVGGPAVRVDWNWYDGAGSNFMTTTGASKSVTASWVRHTQATVVPAGAVYGRPLLVWTGTAVADQTLDLAMVLVETGTTLRSWFFGSTPTNEFVAAHWVGAVNASVSELIDMSSLVRAIKLGGSTLLPDASGTVDLGTLGGGTSSHGALSGLGNDDHPQYLTQVRALNLLYSRNQVDAMVAAAATQTSAADRDRGQHTGKQGISTIDGLQEALDAAGGGGAGPDVPRFVIVASGNEPRPAGAVVVLWLDGRDPSTPQPVNFGANDIRFNGSFTAGADLVAPSVPTGLTITSITASGATLSWTASTDNVGVTGYEVRVDGSISLGVATGLSRAITGLSQNTAHTAQVRARDAAGNWSAWSTAAAFTTSASSDTTAPTVPTGLAPTGISGSGFTVTWGAGTDNVGVTGYDIRLNGGAPETVAADPRTKAFTGLAGETAYTVGIRSRDAAGNVSAYVDLIVTTLEAAGETYSVYGTGAPTGTWTWSNDGTPYIVIARGFQCSAAGARVVGGRAWIPAAASGSLPTEATFTLFGPNANIGTTAVETKVVSTAGATAGSWVEALFDAPEAMDAGEVWMIGVRFTGAGDAGKYSFGTGTRPNSNEVISNGDLGADLAWAAQNGGTAALSSNYKIGTGSVTSPGEQTQSYGVDILVDLEG